MGNFSIAGDFEKLNYSHWLDAVGEDLKLENVEKELNFKSLEGVTYQAFSTQSESLDLDSFPSSKIAYKNLRLGDNFLVQVQESLENGVSTFVIEVEDLTNKLEELSNEGTYYFKLYQNIEEVISRLSVHPNNAQFVYLIDIVKIIETSNIELLVILNNLENLLSINSQVVLLVDGAVVHNSGASMLQELAYLYSIGNQVLSLNSTQLNPCRLQFNIACDSNIFGNIAKLRAFRFVWERLLTEYNMSDLGVEIFATNSLREQTLYDPWVNILRNTASSFSAILGGANLFYAYAYDDLYHKLADTGSNDLSQRISRNSLHILMQESHLDKIVDPLKGSYAVENLTSQLVKNSWDLFLHFEQRGGLLNDLDNFAKEVELISHERQKDVRKRRYSITGVNNFANPEDSIQKLYGLNQVYEKDTSRFPVRRLAYEFEHLRMQYENQDRKYVGYIAIYGDSSKLSARSNFAKNFFEILGIEMTESVGSNLSDKDHLVQMKDANLIVICAKDDDYTSILPLAKETFKGKKLFVAGKSDDEEVECIFMGQDTYSVLEKLVGNLCQ